MTKDENSSVLSRRDTDPLDDPVGESLRGHHAHLARRSGRALTYVPGVATFAAVEPDPDPRRWDDLVRLLGHDAFADMFSCPALPPAHWEPVFVLDGRQMIYAGPGDPGGPKSDPDPDIVVLGAPDVPEMLDLIDKTRPGPFGPRTHELGTYLGVRERGVLVAMAGERLRPPGWTEISAVCTAPEARGRGHAARLVIELISRITRRGEHPFLHVAETNSGAIALYERLGFQTRENVTFRGFRTP